MPITDYYVTTDAMGSVMAVLDEAGNVLERRSYDAFGEATYMLPDGTVVPDSPTGVDIGFQGQLMDELTGMYQMGYRWYSPILGRWVSRDPIGLDGGVNVAVFVENAAVNYFDTYGLDLADSFVEMLPSWTVRLIANTPYLPQELVDYSAGFGDHISFGITSLLRKGLQVDDDVDKCSDSYHAGTTSGVVYDVATTVVSLGMMSSAASVKSVQSGKLLRVDRAEARKVLKLETGSGLFAHHINPLVGNPRGGMSLFPTAGLPAWLKNSRFNLVALSHVEHVAVHQRLAMFESIARKLGLANPTAALVRTLISKKTECDCK